MEEKYKHTLGNFIAEQFQPAKECEEDLCKCNHIRRQHNSGFGKCHICDNVCHYGFQPCLEFRLAENPKQPTPVEVSGVVESWSSDEEGNVILELSETQGAWDFIHLAGQRVTIRREDADGRK